MKAARPVREEVARKRTPTQGVPRRAAYFTPTLRAACQALPWRDVPAVTATDPSHGRRVRRTIKAVQACRVSR